MLKKFLAALAVILAVGGSACAHAHALPGTAVLLKFSHQSVGMQIDAPLDQFELGFKHPWVGNAAAIEQNRVALTEYFLRHIQILSPDGRAWQVLLEGLSLESETSTSPADIRARLTFYPPPGESTRRFRLNYSVINHEVMTHTVLVFASSDWGNGIFDTKPELLGTIRYLTTGLDVNRSEGSFWRGFGSMFALGMQHIAEGTDHLLFLFALVLPAPLMRGEKEWLGYGGVKHAWVKLASLISAFTMGHSLTLLIGAFSPLKVPENPIEIAIAISIFVSALHAWRPVLKGREAWIAGGFGLIHGLAFSETLAGNGLSGWYLGAAVLAFNLGIETIQLLLVALVVPWLILLAKRKHYTILRMAGAIFAGAASLAWIFERTSGKTNAVSGALLFIPQASPYLYIGLVALVLVSYLLPHRRMNLHRHSRLPACFQGRVLQEAARSEHHDEPCMESPECLLQPFNFTPAPRGSGQTSA